MNKGVGVRRVREDMKSDTVISWRIIRSCQGVRMTNRGREEDKKRRREEDKKRGR